MVSIGARAAARLIMRYADERDAARAEVRLLRDAIKACRWELSIATKRGIDTDADEALDLADAALAQHHANLAPG